MSDYIERRPKRQLQNTLENSGRHHLKGGAHLPFGRGGYPTCQGWLPGGRNQSGSTSQILPPPPLMSNHEHTFKLV